MGILKTTNIYRLDTKKYTCADIKAEILEDLNILAFYGYKPINPEKISVKINKRFKRTYGRCDKRGDNFTIQINEKYLRVADSKNVHQTIMHEVIHTLPDCFDHGTIWKSVAQKINKEFDFSISRLSHDPNYYSVLKEEKRKYVVFCPDCNKIIARYRTPSTVYKAICNAQKNKNYKKYRCGICRNLNLIAKIEE